MMLKTSPRKRVPRSPFVITVAVAIAAGSCGGKAFDDSEASGGTSGSGAEGGSSGNGGSAGKGGSGGKGGSAGTSSTGGSGGGSTECPTSMPGHGTACATDGQVCSYPTGPCCPPMEARCVGGLWSGSISSCNPPPPPLCPSTPPNHRDPCMLNPCSGVPYWECNYGACLDGTPQVVARCDSSGWAVSHNSCPSVDGGGVCEPLERQLVELADANRGCQLTSDCRTVLGLCANAADYCDGSFFVNKNIDIDKWNNLANELQSCIYGTGAGCAICDGIPPAPACIGGKCQGFYGTD
jgi:hypothetical protein